MTLLKKFLTAISAFLILHIQSILGSEFPSYVHARGTHTSLPPSQVIAAARKIQPLFDAVDSTKKKPLLVTTFINASRVISVDLLKSNIQKLQLTAGEKVEFVVVVYYGTPKMVYRACYEDLKIAKSIIHCQKALLPSTHTFSLSFPKPVLYAELLPFLPFYQRVMVLDEDISLREFNYDKFMKIWNCADWPSLHPPLIVQGLLYEETQLFPFVHWSEWRSKELSPVIAAEAKFIEQQMPSFDTFFLYWFIDAVVHKMLALSMELQTDWGIDSTWCAAAEQFATDILGWNKNGNYYSCAYLTGSEPFHHMNSRSLATKTANLTLFNKRGKMLIAAWRKEFPYWSRDTRNQPIPNPLDSDSGLKLISTYKTEC
jgi:hypothetical protein